MLTEKEFRNTYKLQKFASNAIEKFNLIFPIKYTPRLAKIVAYITFDGHLTENYKMFLFTAGKISELKIPANLVHEEFDIKGRYKRIATNEYGTSYEYRICNQPIGRIMSLLGAPSGDKIKTKFSVPEWIMKDRENSRAYLKVAFDCEGSVWKKGNGFCISFSMHKDNRLRKTLFDFLTDIRKILFDFNIHSTNIWFGDGNNRKDGIKTIYGKFHIKSKSLDKFYSEIGFDDNIKGRKMKQYLGSRKRWGLTARIVV